MSTTLIDELNTKKLIDNEELSLCREYRHWYRAAIPSNPNPKVMTNDGGGSEEPSPKDEVKYFELYRKAEEILMGLGRDVKDAFNNVVYFNEQPKLRFGDPRGRLYTRNNDAYFYKGLVALVKWRRESKKPKRAA